MASLNTGVGGHIKFAEGSYKFTQTCNFCGFVEPSQVTIDLQGVHFNCCVPTSGGRRVEVLYVTQQKLAAKLSAPIAEAGGLINRGAHLRSDLYWLNGTTAPAVL